MLIFTYSIPPECSDYLPPAVPPGAGAADAAGPARARQPGAGARAAAAPLRAHAQGVVRRRQGGQHAHSGPGRAEPRRHRTRGKSGGLAG